jgi:hypothetical protein
LITAVLSRFEFYSSIAMRFFHTWRS